MLEVPELDAVSVAAAGELLLPRADGTLERFMPGPPGDFERPREPLRSRMFYAAAHVVADPLAAATRSRGALDWDATLAYRRHLWSWGLGVAEAMDTAQRGMGLGLGRAPRADPPLGRRGAGRAAARSRGAGTDQLPAGPATLEAIREAYEEQMRLRRGAGARPILMASRALAAAARGPDDYRAVLRPRARASAEPVILHWLGEMFDPTLAGYWGDDDLDAASGIVLELIADHAERIDGIKVSLLDDEREVACATAARRRAPLHR